MAGICPEGYVLLPNAAYAVAERIFAGRDAHPAVKQAREGGIDTRFTREQLDEAWKVLWEKIDESHKTTFTGREILIYGTPGRHREMVSIDPSKVVGDAFRHRYVGGLLRLRLPLFRELTADFVPPFHNVRGLITSDDLERICANLRRAPKRRAKGPAQTEVRARGRKDLLDLIEEIERSGKWSAAANSCKALNYQVRRLSQIRVSDKTIGRAVKELASSGNDRFLRPRTVRASSSESKSGLKNRVRVSPLSA